MKIAGYGVLDVSKPKDLAYFEKQYECSPWKMLVDQGLFRTSTIRLQDYKYIMFVEPGGGVKRIITLEGKDHLDFYAEPGLEDYGVSNSDCFGCVRCWEQDGEYDYNEIATLWLEDSPYDLKPKHHDGSDDEEYAYFMEDSGEELAEDLITLLGEDHDCTPENTLMISCL